MKKITLLLFAILSVFHVSGQVSSYTFSQSNGTYTALSGATVLATQTAANGTSAGALDDVIYTLPLPFAFSFNSVSYPAATNINVSSNGFITFGATAPLGGNYVPISDAALYSGAIAPFGVDANGGYGAVGSCTIGSPTITITAGTTSEYVVGAPVAGTGIPAGSTVVSVTPTTVTISANCTSTGTGRTISVALGEISYQILGSTPNQKLVIQYKRMRPYNTSLRTIDYQIVLNETTNIIDFVYGFSIGSNLANSVPQVGLRGATNTAFNNRTSTTSWASTTAGAVNTATITFNNLVLPASGLTYSWTPPVPCAGIPTPGTVTPAALSLCTGSLPGNLVASGFSSGVAGLAFQWQESPDGIAWGDAVGGSGATTTTYTPPAYLGTPIQYRLRVTCTNSGLFDYSTPTVITNPANPATQVTNANVTNPWSNSATVNWTNGNGSRRMVVLSDSPTFVDPTNGNAAALVANTVYAGTGQQIIFDGAAATVTVTGLTQATSYYVKVYEYLRCGAGPYDYYYNTSTGTNTATITTIAAPANDLCAGAIPLTVGVDFAANQLSGTLLGATTTAGITPSCQTSFGLDVWYTVTVPASGNVIIQTQVNPSNSMADSIITVYSGACGTLTQVGCDDDGGPTGPNDTMSIVTLTGRTPGEVLYVAVWKWQPALPAATASQFLVSAYDCPSSTPAPTGNATQVFCGSATVADLVTTSGTGIKWYDAPTLGNLLLSTDALISGNTYYASQTVTCESFARLAVVVTVSSQVTPAFEPIAPLCVGSIAPGLPATSTNGITGTWSPTTIDTATAGTVTYTFTADSGQCITATVVTLSVTVNNNPAVALSVPFLPICEGTSTTITANVTNNTPTISYVNQSAVSQTSNMYASQTFGVPLVSPLTGTLFVEPTNGCAAITPGSLAGKIALIQRGTCSFVIKVKNAQDAGAIAVIIYNNQAGIINMAGVDPTITIPAYSMTQADGLALIASTVANEIAVTLSPAAALTYLWSTGETTNPITTSILTANTPISVAVTNFLTGCSTVVNDVIPVTPNTIPTFDAIAPLCVGETAPVLPSSSTNAIAGTWSPATVDTATAGTVTYTFTPDPIPGECLATATLAITVTDCPVPGCFNAPFGQYPFGAAYVPANCNGLAQNALATDCWAGEYSLIAVTSGQTYTFGSSNASDFITISADGGVTAVASGTGSVTWVANLTGNVRFYTHLAGCGTAQVSRTRYVICGIPSSALPDYANLQFPSTISIAHGQTAVVYGQVYEGGLTDVVPNIAGQAPGIQAWVGISPIGSNTNPNTWTTWLPATWNSGYVGNNDEYQATIVASTLAPGTYYYATRFNLDNGAYVYGGTNDGFWDGTTHLSGVLTVAGPSNDNFANPIAVSCGNIYTGNTTFATLDENTAPDGFGTDLDSPNLWYSFTGTGAAQTVTVNLCGSSYDTSVLVYTGTSGSLTLVAANDDDATCVSNGANSSLSFASDGTTTYYITVEGWNAANVGAFTMNVTCAAVTPPAVTNQDCGTALAVLVDGSDNNSDNSFGTVSSTQPACDLFGTIQDVWFSFVAPASGSVTALLTPGTMTSLNYNVYSGTCGALTAVGNCNSNLTAPNTQQYTTLTAGQTYYVQVWSNAAEQGTFVLRITDDGLGNGSFDNANFSYYPNPVKNTLNLSYSQEISNVEVYNLLGQRVSVISVNANQAQIDMSNLPSAAYIVKVTANNQVKTIRVIKE